VSCDIGKGGGKTCKSQVKEKGEIGRRKTVVGGRNIVDNAIQKKKQGEEGCTSQKPHLKEKQKRKKMRYSKQKGRGNSGLWRLTVHTDRKTRGQINRPG